MTFVCFSLDFVYKLFRSIARGINVTIVFHSEFNPKVQATLIPVYFKSEVFLLFFKLY